MAPSIQAILETPAAGETKTQSQLREQAVLIRELRDTITQLRIKLKPHAFAGYANFVMTNDVARPQAAKLLAEWQDRFDEESQVMLRMKGEE